MFYHWQACISLYQEYQSCFQKTKSQTMESPTKRPFEVSEMQIFCKFEGFCKQVEKVRPILTFLNLNLTVTMRLFQVTISLFSFRSHRYLECSKSLNLLKNQILRALRRWSDNSKLHAWVWKGSSTICWLPEQPNSKQILFSSCVKSVKLRYV